MTASVGLDFGCNLVRTAVSENGSAKSFPNRYTERKLPSLEECPAGLAKAQRETLKQAIGQRDSATAEQLKQVFLQLREDVFQQIGEADGTVFTVPACHTALQRTTLRETAFEAGFSAVHLLDESLAPLLVSRLPTEARTVLVYALGAGVFSVTAAQHTGRTTAALWHEGDMQLGGSNFDGIMVRLALERIGWTEADLEKRKEVSFKLWQLAEQLKIGLSRRPVEEFQIDAREWFGEDFGSNPTITGSVTRQEYELLLSPFVDRTIALTLKALEHAGMTPGQIDVVLLVGGSTKTPLVERALEKEFGPKLLRATDEAIALGAAIYGSRLAETEWKRPDAQPLRPPIPHTTPQSPQIPRRETTTWDSMFSSYLKEAQMAWVRGEQEVAIAKIEEMVGEVPKFLAHLYSTRAEALRESGQFDEAIATFKKALHLDHSDQTAIRGFHRSLNRKALQLFERGQLHEARAAIRHSLQLDSKCGGCRQLAAQIEAALENQRFRLGSRRGRGRK